MLDQKFIRENIDLVKASIKNRGMKLDLEGFISLDKGSLNSTYAVEAVFF